MKIIFAGTPEFSVAPLEALIKDHQVVAVFTQPDRKAGRGKKITMPPVKVTALAHQIPVLQPTSLRDQAPLMRQFSADVMVVVAYGVLLPQEILDIPRLGCINIHASILPRWRGAAPIQRAIAAGDKQTGISIMQMEAGLDTGPVFQVFPTQIDKQDTAATLHDRLSILGAEGIAEVLAKLAAVPTLTATPQNDSGANYAKKIKKADANIDWSLSANEIHAQIRAFNPWPISQTFHGDTTDDKKKHVRIRIWQSAVADAKHLPHKSYPSGTITQINEGSIIVACGIGLLQIKVLQRDGGRPLSCKEFCNGYPLSVGELFYQHLI